MQTILMSFLMEINSDETKIKQQAGNSFFVTIVQYFFSDLFAVHEYKVPLCLSHSLERQTMDFHIYFVALFELEAGYFKWCSSSENCFIHCRKRCVHVGKQLDFCSTRQLRLVKTSSRLVLQKYTLFTSVYKLLLFTSAFYQS